MEKKAKIVCPNSADLAGFLLLKEVFLLQDTFSCVAEFCSIRDLVSLNKTSKALKKQTGDSQQWPTELLRVHTKFFTETAAVRRLIYAETKYSDADDDEEDDDEERMCLQCGGFMPEQEYKISCWDCAFENVLLLIFSDPSPREVLRKLRAVYNIACKVFSTYYFFKLMIHSPNEPSSENIRRQLHVLTVLNYYAIGCFRIL
jgi:hypothetical protein